MFYVYMKITNNTQECMQKKAAMIQKRIKWFKAKVITPGNVSKADVFFTPCVYTRQVCL